MQVLNDNVFLQNKFKDILDFVMTKWLYDFNLLQHIIHCQ